MPKNTLLRCPEFTCRKRFSSDIWRLKHIKKCHPDRLQIASSKVKSTSLNTSPTVTSAEDRDFNANKDPVNDPDAFPYLEHLEAIAQQDETPFSTSELRHEIFPGAGSPLLGYSPGPGEGDTGGCLEINLQNNPYFPFASREEYKFVQCGIKKKGMKTYYDEVLKEENTSLRFPSFKNGDGVNRLLASMPDDMAMGEWELHTLENIGWNENHQTPIKYWSRDIIKCIRWLMRQPAYAEHLAYAPQRSYNNESPPSRQYSEMNTADWWWETQSTLSFGDTLVPLIFMSDGTHLSNYAGDKKEWPVYMTIGNLSSKIRQSPSSHSIVLVSLLPIPIKSRNVPQKRLEQQKKQNRAVLNEVLQRLLSSLTFQPNLDESTGYYNILCADGHFRRCKPVLAAWLADCPEYCDLHHLQRNVCFWCECPKNELGDYVATGEEHPRRDHNKYRMLSNANTPVALQELYSRSVHPGFNIFRHIPCIVSDLPKPDLLHTIQLGMLDHLQKWIFHFMKMHGRLDRYNAIWLSVPSYHNLTPKNKSYEEVSQWSGKEMKEMSRYLLGVVVQSLNGGSSSQRPLFNRAILCTRALLEFYMYAQYKSHDEESLSGMDDALKRFHSSKDVFLLGRAGKKAKSNAKVLRSELIQQRNAEDNANADIWTPSERRQEMNAWQEYIKHETELSKESEANFNFPKIHLLTHWTEQIRRYGALHQYSAEIHERAHKANLKDGWNASNHNLNYLPQVITFHRRILCFEIRELNLQALDRRSVNMKSQSQPVGTCLEDYMKPEFIGPQKMRDGKHHDAMINDFGALLDSTECERQRNAIRESTREFILRKSRNDIYYSDQELRSIELCIYHGIKVQVGGLHGDRKSQICRCTGNQSWRGGQKRNDWVWIQQRPGRCYGALNGRLPWQLQRLFKLKIKNNVGEEVEYWLAAARATVAENSGKLDSVSGFVHVRKAPSETALKVFSVGNIVGSAHVIPDYGTAGSENERWLVNSHIDLETWNHVY